QDERLMTGAFDGPDGGYDRSGLDDIPDIRLETTGTGDGGVRGRHRHVARPADRLAELQHHLGVDDEHRTALRDALADLVDRRDLTDEGALERQPAEVPDHGRQGNSG